MDPNTQPEPLDKPKLLTASKRPRNKRKLKQANALAKPSYNPPMYGERSNSNKDNTVEPNFKGSTHHLLLPKPLQIMDLLTSPCY